jgi:hypothetical protein
VGTTLAVVIGLGVFAGAGGAASQAKPKNIDPPTITGVPQEGHPLVGHRGTWTGHPTDYNDFWMRCDKNGGSCSNITGANDKNGYLLKAVDVGNMIRFKVQAKNADGSTFATSVPTAVIAAAVAPPPPPPATGCPASRHQQLLLAMFVRARKSGEDLLGGVSTRRLFSVQVSL